MRRAALPGLLLCICAAAACACHVAIVGGGVGGAFSAAFLHELLSPSAIIDVYAIFHVGFLSSVKEGSPAGMVEQPVSPGSKQAA